MTRDTRMLVVLLVAVLTGGAAAYGVLRYVRSMPLQQVQVASTYAVVATRPLVMGTKIAAEDVKLVAWPESAPVPGAFNKVDTVLNRGVLVPIEPNEPLTASKLAPIEAGSGLSPTIPEGMRAISVQVNEVIGVAGFVTPGTRVDVLATFKRAEEGVTRVVVSNVQVLTAGTRYDQGRTASSGEAMPSSVVTLLLTPADAERVVLASNEGQIMLALRNPLDVQPSNTDGTRTAALLGAPAPPPAAPVTRPARPKVVEPPAPPPPAPPKVYTVETIRAAKRAEEPVR